MKVVVWLIVIMTAFFLLGAYGGHGVEGNGVGDVFGVIGVVLFVLAGWGLINVLKKK